MASELFRKTSQDLMPATHTPHIGHYDLYPAFPVTTGTIQLGLEQLADWLIGRRVVVIDGFSGVLWDDLRERLDFILTQRGLHVAWSSVATAMLPEAAIDDLIKPFLGGDDPIFGKRYTGTLNDFFDPTQLASLQPDPAADLTILYGCGAALAHWDAAIVYIDIPKNEIQFRARAASITNFGASSPTDPKAMYKRMYFVDWVALSRHKAQLLPTIDLIVDGQRPAEPAMMAGAALRTALSQISQSFFRVRPWFEPGPWGGQWIKAHIPELPAHVPNYAWSFELISPENGLLFSADQQLLEVSFDFLMFHDHRAVLGDSADLFGYEFPIRFDFLDTFAGGNLSVQCHPRPAYIREHFGETFTQDETYYILDAGADAEVYLGFQEQIDPATFRAALEQSFMHAQPLAIEQFVQRIPAHKHDLFLIPNGTIHCSGINNLVLEISATPYIFTFKMYDWLRLDLDGRPRPLNIARAFENLYFERKGVAVQQELIAQPTEIAAGSDWRCIQLSTHPEHFYDIYRYEFEQSITIETAGSAHVLSLVEGQTVQIEANGRQQIYSYAETFVVPAATISYRLTNTSNRPAWVIMARIKPEATI